MSEQEMLYRALVRHDESLWRIGVRRDAEVVLLTCAPVTFALSPALAAEIGGHLQEAAVQRRRGEGYVSPLGPGTPYLVMVTPSTMVSQLRIGEAWINMPVATGEALGYHLQVAGELAEQALQLAAVDGPAGVAA